MTSEVAQSGRIDNDIVCNKKIVKNHLVVIALVFAGLLVWGLLYRGTAPLSPPPAVGEWSFAGAQTVIEPLPGSSHAWRWLYRGKPDITVAIYEIRKEGGAFDAVQRWRAPTPEKWLYREDIVSLSWNPRRPTAPRSPASADLWMRRVCGRRVIFPADPGRVAGANTRKARMPDNVACACNGSAPDRIGEVDKHLGQKKGRTHSSAPRTPLLQVRLIRPI